MKYSTLLAYLFLPLFLSAQKIVQLDNSSFEDTPSNAKAPKGWTPCGMEGESVLDIQPGSYGCELAPAHGASYLGMVTRDNHTWEGVAQKLSAPLDSGICHTFTIQLATSQNYNSYARLDGAEANYNEPVVLQIWGGYGICGEVVLLGESPPIAHREWHTYRFIMRHLEAKPLTHLMFQAYYPLGKRCQPTIGNLLLDNVSDITPTNCPTNLVNIVTKEDYIPEVPMLKSEADLDAFLIQELAAIRYNNRTLVRFEYQCYENQIGKAVFYGGHLTAAAEGIKQFPQKKLILRTKNARNKVLEQRADFLKKFLRESGLSENQFDIKLYRKNEEGAWKVNTSWLSARW